MMNVGGIAFRHETENIDINIQVNAVFERNIFAFSQYFIQSNFNLKFPYKVSKRIITKNRMYRSSCECDRSTWYFLVENFREDIPHGTGARVEKINNQSGKGRVSKVVRMAL